VLRPFRFRSTANRSLRGGGLALPFTGRVFRSHVRSFIYGIFYDTVLSFPTFAVGLGEFKVWLPLGYGFSDVVTSCADDARDVYLYGPQMHEIRRSEHESRPACGAHRSGPRRGPDQ
jgi:hypothetical protein